MCHFNLLLQSLRGSSSSTVFKSINTRFKKVKPTLLLSALPGPLPMLVPGCSAQPAQPLAICSVAQQPTNLPWVILWDLGLASSCPPSSCLSSIAWHRVVISKMFSLKEIKRKSFDFHLDHLVCSALPKEGQSINLISCCPFPVWIPLHPDTP